MAASQISNLRSRLRAVALAAVVGTVGFAFNAPSSAQADSSATVVIVTGAEGEPEFGRAFETWADRWEKAAQAGSVGRVVQIGRDRPAATTGPASAPVALAPATTPASDLAPVPIDRQPATSPSDAAPGGMLTTAPATAPTTGPATDKDRLQTFLQSEPKDGTAPLWVVLIGHGTDDGREAKFNLRGPDVSDQELAEWLRAFRRPVAVIDCSSASAAFLNRLAAPDRVVITASRSRSEIQFAHFGEHLSATIADPAADLDKDGQTSLLEAFLAASHRTNEFYQRAGRLVTEHALLDDNGDGLGIGADWFQGTRATTRPAQGAAPLDGRRAAQWHLVPSPAERAIPPDLRARRDELELAVEALRQRKTAMPEADYAAQLERVLLDLARLYRQIETSEGAPGRPSSKPAGSPAPAATAPER